VRFGRLEVYPVGDRGASTISGGRVGRVQSGSKGIKKGSRGEKKPVAKPTGREAAEMGRVGYAGEGFATGEGAER
jgi:hypothetical protein